MEKSKETERVNQGLIDTVIVASNDALKDKVEAWFAKLGLKDVSLERIERLLCGLVDGLTFVMEYPYVDAHFRDCYYTYYAKKFADYSRDTIRVHIFSGQVQRDETETDLNDKYLGYFIARPLLEYPLGRSFISPKSLKRKDFVCCLMGEDVYLLDYKLHVDGFPHVVQDSAVQTCAESALWTLITYYGSKYSFYRTMLPSKITGSLPVTGQRHLPSNGLGVTELLAVLASCGHSCLLYKKSKEVDFFAILHVYIESGIPVILILKNETEGHAVVAMGHGTTSSTGAKQVASDQIVDVSSIKDTLVLMDDNLMPYYVAAQNAPTKLYEKNSNMQIIAFIAPLHRHMFLEAGTVRRIISKLLANKDFNVGGGFLTRLLLTTGRAFKHSLGKDCENKKIREILIRMPLPKFIWICEIYRGVCYEDVCREKSDAQCSGLVIIDSTGKGVSSVLLYILDDNLYMLKGDTYEKPRLESTFRKRVYRHNLKGAWKGWRI